MKLQAKDSIGIVTKDAALDPISGMIIELEGAVLEQIAGGDGAGKTTDPGP